jgi:bacillaene synthase trans-acting acyltransferase
MGQQLFEQHAVFKKSMEESEQVVQKLLHRSLIAELYQETEENFDDLLITHPAIVAVEIALYHTLLDMNIRPAYVSGNSLGEFAAGVAAGVWSAEAAVEAAVEQAKSMLRCDIDGGLLVVLTEKESLWPLYQHYQLFLAADNFPGHFTLAGTAQHLDLFQVELSLQGISFVRLPVACPFHSPLLHEARDNFAFYTACMPNLSTPQVSFVSGITAKEEVRLPANYFWEAVSKYTCFPSVVQYLESKGPCFYIDLGPSGASATLLKYNLSSSSVSEIFQIMSPFKREMEQLRKLETIWK